MTERKKKDVDLDSRPALLRRPISTATHNNTRRHCKTKSADSWHCSRPHSAPVTDLGAAPLSYCPPKPTVLYDISHKPTTTPFVRGLRSSINSDRPPSNNSCRPLHQCQNFGGGYETPMGVCISVSLSLAICSWRSPYWVSICIIDVPHTAEHSTLSIHMGFECLHVACLHKNNSQPVYIFWPNPIAL